MVNLFATSLNAKLWINVSPILDVDAEGVNAFSRGWTGLWEGEGSMYIPCTMLLITPS